MPVGDLDQNTRQQAAGDRRQLLRVKAAFRQSERSLASLLSVLRRGFTGFNARGLHTIILPDKYNNP